MLADRLHCAEQYVALGDRELRHDRSTARDHGVMRAAQPAQVLQRSAKRSDLVSASQLDRVLRELAMPPAFELERPIAIPDGGEPVDELAVDACALVSIERAHDRCEHLLDHGRLAEPGHRPGRREHALRIDEHEPLSRHLVVDVDADRGQLLADPLQMGPPREHSCRLAAIDRRAQPARDVIAWKIVLAEDLDRVTVARRRRLPGEERHDGGRAAQRVRTATIAHDGNAVGAQDVEQLARRALVERIAAQREDVPRSERAVATSFVFGERRPLRGLHVRRVATDAEPRVAGAQGSGFAIEPARDDPVGPDHAILSELFETSSERV